MVSNTGLGAPLLCRVIASAIVRVSLLTSLLVLGGCTELPAIKYESEEILLGTSFDEPVCAGTLAQLDEQARFAQNWLGVERDEPIELYWFDELPAGLCSVERGGCYDRESGRAYGEGYVLRHEIVHAVAAELGYSRRNDFLEEGIADALSGEWTAIGTQWPSVGLSQEPEDVEYKSAAHFVRWLEREHGADKLVDALEQSRRRHSPKKDVALIEETYGSSLSEIERDYYESSPERFGSLTECQEVDGVFEIEPWTRAFDLDCGDESTHGRGGVAKRLVLEVGEDGEYVLDAEPPAVARVRRCVLDDLAAGENAPYPVYPVGRLAGSDDLLNAAPWFEGTTSLQLVSGRYVIEIKVEDALEASVVLHGHRKLGDVDPGVP